MTWSVRVWPLNVRAVGRFPLAPRVQLRLEKGKKKDVNEQRPADAEYAELRNREMLPESSTDPIERGFRVESAADEHHELLTPVGEFDGSALTAFEEAFRARMASEKPIVIDLGRVTFIDSSGLWAIIVSQRICRQHGIGLLLKPGPDNVQSVFEVTGLYDLLPFSPPTPAEAP
jgi:anti-anti-sigma factor